MCERRLSNPSSARGTGFRVGDDRLENIVKWLSGKHKKRPRSSYMQKPETHHRPLHPIPCPVAPHDRDPRQPGPTLATNKRR